MIRRFEESELGRESWSGEEYVLREALPGFSWLLVSRSMRGVTGNLQEFCVSVRR